jgi:hypothetical protein
VRAVLEHGIITALVLLTFWVTKQLLVLLHMDGNVIPIVNFPFEDWMFILEVLAATVIIGSGVIRAAFTLWRSR